MELFGISIPLCVIAFIVSLLLEVIFIIKAAFFQKNTSLPGCLLLFFGGCAVAFSILWMLLYFFATTFNR